MPEFLESKLKQQYGADSDIPYRIMNSKGYMRGNRETARGRQAEIKHWAHSKGMKTAQLGMEVDQGEPDPEELARAEAEARAIRPWKLPAPPPPAPNPEAVDPTVLNTVPPNPNVISAGGPSSPDEMSRPPQGPAPRMAPDPMPPAGPSETNPGGEPTVSIQPRRPMPQTEGLFTDINKVIGQKPPSRLRQVIGGLMQGSPTLRGVGREVSGEAAKQRDLERIKLRGYGANEEQQLATHEDTVNINRLKAESLSEERKSLADARSANAQARTLAAKNAEEGNRRKTFEDALKIRQMGGKTQPSNAPIPPGYTPLPDPMNPESVYIIPETKTHFVVNKSFMDMANEVGVGGLEEGQLVSMEVWQKVADSAGKLEAVRNKPESSGLDAPTRTAIASFGGDPKKPEDVAKARKMIQAESISAAAAKRKPTEATLMVPDGNGGMTMRVVRPGQSVPAGAVSTSGMSSMNVPTAATRAMAERAPRVVDFVNRIEALIAENEKQLGPLSGRWAEFTAGKIGLPNRGYTQLRTDLGLLSTALMNMHVGARGSEKIMEHFQEMINGAKQDPENLRAALGEIKTYAYRVQEEGGPRGATPAPTQGGGAPPPAPKIVKTPDGKEWEERGGKMVRIR